MSASMGCERDRERMGGDPGTSGTAASSCSVARRAGRVPLRLTASVIGGMEDGVGTMNSVAHVPLPHESETGACVSAQDMESHTKGNTAGSSSASRGSVRAKIDMYAKFKLTKMRETNGARDIGHHTQGGATWLTEEAMESEGGGHVMQHGSAWDGGASQLRLTRPNGSRKEGEERTFSVPLARHMAHTVCPRAMAENKVEVGRKSMNLMRTQPTAVGQKWRGGAHHAQEHKRRKREWLWKRDGHT